MVLGEVNRIEMILSIKIKLFDYYEFTAYYPNQWYSFLQGEYYIDIKMDPI